MTTPNNEGSLTQEPQQVAKALKRMTGIASDEYDRISTLAFELAKELTELEEIPLARIAEALGGMLDHKAFELWSQTHGGQTYEAYHEFKLQQYKEQDHPKN